MKRLPRENSAAARTFAIQALFLVPLEVGACYGALNGASPVVVEGVSFCDARCGGGAGDGVMISIPEVCAAVGDATGFVSAASSATGPSNVTFQVDCKWLFQAPDACALT